MIEKCSRATIFLNLVPIINMRTKGDYFRAWFASNVAQGGQQNTFSTQSVGFRHFAEY